MAKLSLSFLILLLIVPSGYGDLGTAALFNPPYIPNACDLDETQLPANNMFAAAGEGLWNNGTACGNQYQVTCTSAAPPGACIPGKIITVMIVDNALALASHPSKEGTLMVISGPGYHAIATPSAKSINIDYKLSV